MANVYLQQIDAMMYLIARMEVMNKDVDVSKYSLCLITSDNRYVKKESKVLYILVDFTSVYLVYRMCNSFWKKLSNRTMGLYEW